MSLQARLADNSLRFLFAVLVLSPESHAMLIFVLLLLSSIQLVLRVNNGQGMM